MTDDNENGLDYEEEPSPSSPTPKSLPRSASGTTVSSQGTQGGGKSKKPFFKKVFMLLCVHILQLIVDCRMKIAL